MSLDAALEPNQTWWVVYRPTLAGAYSPLTVWLKKQTRSILATIIWKQDQIWSFVLWGTQEFLHWQIYSVFVFKISFCLTFYYGEFETCTRVNRMGSRTPMNPSPSSDNYQALASTAPPARYLGKKITRHSCHFIHERFSMYLEKERISFFTWP